MWSLDLLLICLFFFLLPPQLLWWQRCKMVMMLMEILTDINRWLEYWWWIARRRWKRGLRFGWIALFGSFGVSPVLIWGWWMDGYIDVWMVMRVIYSVMIYDARDGIPIHVSYIDRGWKAIRWMNCRTWNEVKKNWKTGEAPSPSLLFQFEY